MKPRASDGRSKIRVAHVITGLGVGGAETMLVRLVDALNSSVENIVICLSRPGPMAARIRAVGVRVEALDLPSDPRALLGLPKLVRLLRELRPDVVHTWMYHADFLGGLAARLNGAPVIWALHNSTLDPSQTGRSTRLIVKALARLSSSVPTRIVSCSEVGRRIHEEIGYSAERMTVIENGFDTTQFRPNAEYRAEARGAWNCRADDFVVGHVARFHPQKDHRTFLAAAGLAAQREPNLRFVLYGAGVTPDNRELAESARAAGVLERCSFLGLEQNVARRLPGLDLLVSSSSFGEAFPLVLGEAMASGVLCVTTDVGDSALIVGDTERVVPAANSGALAEAIVRAARLSQTERENRSIAGIARIRDRFELSQIARRYSDLYLEVARGLPKLAPD
jgi:glycosyltransferase involved in cell wall biosynthesis